MAIESNTYSTHGTYLRKRVLCQRPCLFNIEEKILKCDFNSLRPVARRQIINYYKQLKFFPNRRSIYIERINLVILDDKLFRNLFFLKIFKKKSEQENE